jgi:NAD(P)-dependent dehydrogenase (short-subunit alcohol dehydrogenase family)
MQQSRLELKQFGINVVIVEPGVIKTGFADAMDQKFTEDSSSPYKEMKHLIARMMENTNNPGQYSEPTVIANTISKAIKSKKPKTRYAAGKMARQTLLARKLLSDKGFDKMFLRMVKNYANQ